MARMRVGIMGSGGRSILHIKALKAMEDEFEICSVLFRSQKKAERFNREFGVPGALTMEQFLTAKPDFVIVCINYYDQDAVIIPLLEAGIPVLAETPPATSMENLYKLWNLSEEKRAKILIAENCFEQPFWKSKLEAIKRGYLGDVNTCTIGHTHEYHAFSVMRLVLDEMDSPFTMVGKKFDAPITLTHDHSSRPILPGMTQYADEYLSKHMDYDFKLTTDAEGRRILDGVLHNASSYHAMVEFESGKLGIYDFQVATFWSGIRSRCVLIRGSRGEIKDDQIKYVAKNGSCKTAVLQSRFTDDGGLIDISMDGDVLYTNDLLSRGIGVNPDLAKMSLHMKHYIETGDAPYSFANGLQDTYMTMLLHHEVGNRPYEVIHSEKQPWQK